MLKRNRCFSGGMIAQHDASQEGPVRRIKCGFRKRKEQLSVMDMVITIFATMFLGVMRPDKVVMASFVLAFPYLMITRRSALSYHLLVSSSIALAWTAIARKEYGYARQFFSLFGLNAFPLFAWAAGLFATYLIYSRYECLLQEKSYIRKLALFSLIYWPLLIAVETAAYHLFDIRNIAAAAYSGLPVCDCLHAPLWMQAAYFLMGPLFFSICYALKLESPRRRIRSPRPNKESDNMQMA